MERPDVMTTAWLAWSSAFAAIRAMKLTFVVTFLFALVTQFVTIWLGILPAIQEPSDSVPNLVALDAAPVVFLALLVGSVLQAFAYAPLTIAVHRFVLLGATRPMLPVLPISRLLRFVAWLVILGLGFKAGSVIRFTLHGLGLSLIAGGLVSVVWFIVWVIVGVRLLLLFPGIAIDAPIDAPRASWRSTRGNFWRISVTSFLTYFPALLVAGLLLVGIPIWFASRAESQSGAALHATTFQLGFAVTLASAVIGPVSVALGAALASWLFRALVDVTPGRPDLAPSP